MMASSAPVSTDPKRRVAMSVVPQLTFLVAIAYLLVRFFNWQASIGPDSEYSLGLFRSTVGNVSARYPTPLTPARYTFDIWGVIYAWWALWIVYVIITLFRSNRLGPVYLNPPVTTAGFLVAVWLTLTCNVTFLFVWDREVIILAAAANTLSSVALYLAISIHTAKVYEYLFVFREYGRLALWANRVFIHNGLAIYATWSTVATTNSYSSTLIYWFGVDEDITAYICLALLGSQLITYFVLDCFVYDRYFRYILIVYPAAMWALGGILVNNIDDPDSPQAVVGASLFALVFVFFVIKTVFVLVRDPVTVIAKENTLGSVSKVAYTKLDYV